MWMIPDAEIDRLIEEDAPMGDLTTEALGIGHRSGRIAFVAREPLVAAGVEIAARILARCGVAATSHIASGDRVRPGETLLSGEGAAEGLHLAWKVSVTLLESLSGVASATREMVDAAGSVDPAVRVACTRKAFPGTRRLAQRAVVAGGGIVHRAGLSETILLFAEHRRFLPDPCFASLVAQFRRAAPEKALAIEVTCVADAAAAIAAGFDVIQLDKMPLADIATVAGLARAAARQPVVAAAGGVNAANAAEHVRAGATLLVTSWPYAARPRDIGAQLTAA